MPDTRLTIAEFYCRSISWGICFLIISCLCGCGNNLAVVTGTVTLQGKPLAGAMISFNNPDTGMSREFKIKPDGTYEVKILEGKGLPPGKYLVAVHPHYSHIPPNPGPDGQIRSDNPIDLIPPKYRNYQTSDLVLDLPPEGKVFDVTVPVK
ncbi:MAG: carboxypeptidase-like regulatory domain-containing protein [Pirellulales bacterium]|nr:carboxypeptidase-like regulatory domain-containing protein [Pirellulales bacterium]